MKGTIVFGEGDRDEARCCFIGEKVEAACLAAGEAKGRRSENLTIGQGFTPWGDGISTISQVN
jgi:hypothetical protein